MSGAFYFCLTFSLVAIAVTVVLALFMPKRKDKYEGRSFGPEYKYREPIYFAGRCIGFKEPEEDSTL